MTIDVDYDRVEELAGQGLSKTQIAHCLGIGRSTLFDKQKSDPDFLDAIKRGKSKGLETVTNALMENARGGNVTAQIFYLKNRAPDKWQDRRQNEHTGKDGGPIKMEARAFEFVDPEITEEA